MSKFLKLRVHLESPAYSTTYLKSIVGPASKLHITILVIEREPSDVNLTCGFEYSWRNISTTSCVCHHYIGWEGSIKLLISAEKLILIFQNFHLEQFYFESVSYPLILVVWRDGWQEDDLLSKQLQFWWSQTKTFRLEQTSVVSNKLSLSGLSSKLVLTSWNTTILTFRCSFKI